jgi:hypothetical protein
MATSGTSVFNPDASELIEEAYERIGVIDASGYDVRTARRSLNILGLEWANRQVHLWTIDSSTIPLIPATKTYTLPADTIDLLDVVIRTVNAGVNTDLAIGRLSVGDYSAIPTKDTPGRPVQYYVNRQGAAPTVTVWPVPPTQGVAWTALTAVTASEIMIAPAAVGGFVIGQPISANSAFTTRAAFDATEAANWTAAQTYTLVYWRMRRIQDIGSDGAVTADVGARAIPALIAGLAYYLAQKKAPMRLQECKAIYDEQFELMVEEDRERSSFMVAPKYNR